MIRRAFRGRVRGSGDEGISTVEAAILFPVVILLMLAMLQAGIWYHARTAALAAAQEGGRAATAAGGTVDDATAAAQHFLASKAGGEVHGASVEVSASDQTVTVVVKGTSTSLVPGWKPQVTATTKTPVERLTR